MTIWVFGSSVRYLVGQRRTLPLTKNRNTQVGMNMIINEENKKESFLIYKFSEKRWIDLFVKGHFNFSCAGAYIRQGLETGNKEQGDPYEAIFARVEKGDPRITNMQKRLGNDLEIIDDEKYVMLRRYSAYLVPTFCFFHYKIEDISRGQPGIPQNGILPITLEFDERMYNSFASSTVTEADRKLTVVAIYVHIFNSIARQFIQSEFGRKASARMGGIDYKKRAKCEFFIEPTDSYDELFYKRKEYEYQHEGRIILPNYKFCSIYDRYNLVTDAFDESGYYLTDDVPFKIVLYATIQNNEVV